MIFLTIAERNIQNNNPLVVHFYIKQYMLEFLLELTRDILSETGTLTQKKKQLVHDQVLYAINQTKSHMQSTSSGGIDKSSAILSNIWQRAAVRIQTINNRRIKQLAETIEQKSRYWADTEKYNRNQFTIYEMKISQVEQTLKELCK